MLPLIVAPSAIVTESEPIVMVSVTLASPPMFGGDELATLSARIIPTPPACWTRSALDLNEQLPRSTRTILPATVFVSAVHASLVVAMPSFASTTPAVMSKLAGPNDAVFTDGGRFAIAIERSSLPLHRNTCMRGGMPSDGVDMFALLREPPSALS